MKSFLAIISCVVLMFAVGCSGSDSGHSVMGPAEYKAGITETEMDFSVDSDDVELELDDDGDIEEAEGLAKVASSRSYYNVTGKSGELTVEQINGIIVKCCDGQFTRSYNLYRLKEDAVVSEAGGSGLLGGFLWFLNLYFDECNRVKRYVEKVEKYEEKAEKYQDKADYYARKARKASSSSRRRKYQRYADKYDKKVVYYLGKVDKYREKIQDIADDLNDSAPSNVTVWSAG